MKRFLRALLFPFLSTIETGHWLSALHRRPVDGRGRPIPLYTYPAIDCLARVDMRGREVLEFGSGHSTVWWSNRGARVTALEAWPKWYREIIQKAPAAATILLVREDLQNLPPIAVPPAGYDVIVIDGLDRYRAKEMAIEWLRPGGAIIVDDAQSPDLQALLDQLRAAGFSCVEFWGHTADMLWKRCTSICYKDRCFLFEQPALG